MREQSSERGDLVPAAWPRRLPGPALLGRSWRHPFVHPAALSPAGLAHWYYVSVQRLPLADLPLVYTTALLFLGFPVTVALRCHREGMAALEHRTPTILAGDFAYMAALAVAASACLALKVPGNIIGPLVVASSNLASLGMLVLLLRERARRRTTLGTDRQPRRLRRVNIRRVNTGHLPHLIGRIGRIRGTKRINDTTISTAKMTRKTTPWVVFLATPFT